MKLEYQNNWESDIYTVEGKTVLTLKKVCIDGVEYKVTAREVEVPYYDMGHHYSAFSTHYFINATVFGQKMEFDLNQIKVPITALKYTVVEE